MCGIVGYIKLADRQVSDKEHDELVIRTTLIDLFENSVARGRDACGYAFSSNNQIVYHKQKGAANQNSFIDTLNASFDTHGLPEVFIGHTRAKTKGDFENNNNNHPIVSHNNLFATVHNGHINNDDELRKTLPPNVPSNAEVDSEIITRLLEVEYNAATDRNPRTIIKCVQNVTKQLAGGFACATIDAQNPRRLILFKHGNPIVLCGDIENGIVWFASLSKYLEDSINPRTLFFNLLVKNGSKNFVINDVPDNKVLIIDQLNSKEFSSVMADIDYKAYTQPTSARYTNHVGV